MKKRIEIMPDLPAFRCKRCGRGFVFAYRLTEYEEAKLSKICASCVIGALDRLYEEAVKNG